MYFKARVFNRFGFFKDDDSKDGPASLLIDQPLSPSGTALLSPQQRRAQQILQKVSTNPEENPTDPTTTDTTASGTFGGAATRGPKKEGFEPKDQKQNELEQEEQEKEQQRTQQEQQNVSGGFEYVQVKGHKKTNGFHEGLSEFFGQEKTAEQKQLDEKQSQVWKTMALYRQAMRGR